MTITDSENPPEASIVEPLLPPGSAKQEDAEVVAVSLIPEGEMLQENDRFASVSAEEPSDLLFVSIDDSGWEHGETQQVKCQNSCFALLFLLQLFGLLGFSVWGIVNLPSIDKDQRGISVPVGNALWFFLCLVLCIILISTSLLTCLLSRTRTIKKTIRFSLIISPIVWAVMAILSLAVWPVAMMFAALSIIGACYSTRVWHRVPIAACNLSLGMTAIQPHKRSLIGLGYFLAFVTQCLIILWAIAVGQISFLYPDMWKCLPNDDDTAAGDNNDCTLTTVGTWIFIGLVLCLYWTVQVINNLYNTTVAGVIGWWWFTTSPEVDEEEDASTPLIAEPKRVVYDSWIRASVYSLGSICLGSLIVAILQVLQYLVRSARQERRNRGASGSLLWCLLQCLVDQVERLAEYFNRWAFVYVGLYGYDYVTSGSMVYQLFQARGWSVIINDQLVARCMSQIQLLVVLLSTLVGIGLGWLFFGKDHHYELNTLYTCAGIAFMLGLILSNVLFQLVFSAVDTIMVCFAEAPNQLVTLAREDRLKPELANEMIQAWRRVYPDDCGF